MSVVEKTIRKLQEQRQQSAEATPPAAQMPSPVDGVSKSSSGAVPFVGTPLTHP